MAFSKNTKIVNIGFLPGHVNAKAKLLHAAGFGDVVTVALKPPTEWDAAKIRQVLAAAAPDALLLAGGAMMTEAPELMADLQAFIAAECPGVRIALTTKADFDADVSFPPTEEQVAKSGLNICTRLLAEAEASAKA